MADYNPNTLAAYQQYGQSMIAGGGGSNLSGLGARTTSSGTLSSRLDDKGYTPTKSTSTKSGIAYIENYGDDSDNIPMTPEQIYTAAAQATTEVGGLLVPNITAPMIHAANLYSMPNMVQQVSDYVYRADRNDAITNAIRSTQQEEQDSVDAAIKSINKAITQGKTDAEIAEAFLNDMGGMGNDKPDETGGFGVPGVTLKDVTGTDEGALSNPQPLYDFAEEMRNPSITVEELPPLTPDQKEKLGAKLREASDKGDLSSVMNQLAQDSRVQLSSAVTNFIEGAETQVASNDIDPFTGQPIGNNELGFTDVSPAQEAPDQLGLMARPAASNDERQDPSYWDRVLFGGDETETPVEEPAVEAEAPAETTTDTFVSDFVDLMGEREGTEDHTAQEGQFTYAYGITQGTADRLGINADDYDTRRDFAEAVYTEMYNEATNEYPDVFDGMESDDQQNVMSMYINLGRLPTGVANALSGPNKDFEAAGRSLTNVIHYTQRTGANAGTKYSSKGLSKRRAEEYNSLMGEGSVATVNVLEPRSNPTFQWLDSDGNVVESYTSNKPLSPDNSFRSVSVD